MASLINCFEIGKRRNVLVVGVFRQDDCVRREPFASAQ
jgi:hypothetical protein